MGSHSYRPRISFRSESRLVQLEVVVRDGHGQPIAGLQKDDFSVSDSGNRRDLTAFSVDTTGAAAATVRQRGTTPPAQAEAPLPVAPDRELLKGRFIGLFFDDINTGPGDLAHAKIAASRFIREAIASGDRLGVFSASGGQILPFTADTAPIKGAVATIQAHPRVLPGGLAVCPRITGYQAYRIVNNDPNAMQAAVEEACHCAAGPSCDVSHIPPNELLNSTSKSAEGTYVSGGTLGSLIESVKAQARETWDQTEMVSQMTLEAIRKCVGELARVPGKPVLLLASAGFLSGALDAQQDSIINEALRAGVVINSLDAKGLYAEAPGKPLSEAVQVTELPIATLLYETRSLGERLDSVDAAMARLAESTGGLLFRNNNDLDLGFYQLGVVPGVTYLLAFPPAEDGKYHKVKVGLSNRRHAFIQVRPGYFAPAKTSRQQPSAGDAVDREAVGEDAPHFLPATVTVQLGTAANHARRISIKTHVDVKKLPFEQQKDRHIEKLIFVAVLFDEHGNYVTGKRAEMDLALKQGSFEQLSTSGIDAAMWLEGPAGTYRLRTVVQEAAQGNISAESQQVQLQ